MTADDREVHKDILLKAANQNQQYGFRIEEVQVEEYSSGICKTTYIYRRAIKK